MADVTHTAEVIVSFQIDFEADEDATENQKHGEIEDAVRRLTNGRATTIRVEEMWQSG
jgi:hypothetical protein